MSSASGSAIRSGGGARSGGLTANVLVLEPGQVIACDAVDLGWAVSSDRRLYAFNTASFQSHLAPGQYVVDYELYVDRKKLEGLLQLFFWLREPIENLWTGRVTLTGVTLELPNTDAKGR